jgi:hypothetical protein
MNQYNYFVRVPEALYDALRDGEITPLMYDIMTHLHRWADWSTGIVRSVNAKRLRSALGGHHFDEDIAAERTIQRHMQGLDEAGWLISGYVNGMKQPYGVQITNYQPAADEDGEKALIIPMETNHWKETSAFQGGEEGGEQALTQAVSRRLKERDSIQDSSTQDSSPDSKPVSQLVSKHAPRGSLRSPSTKGSVERNSNPTEDGMSVPKKNQKAKPTEAQIMAAAQFICDWAEQSKSHQDQRAELGIGLAEAFGLERLMEEHMPAYADIIQRRDVMDWTARHIVRMAKWARSHKFWKTRIHTLNSFAKAVGKDGETSLPSQFQAWLTKQEEDHWAKQDDLHDKCKAAEMISSYRKLGFEDGGKRS